MGMIKQAFYSFIIYNVNAFYYILYLLKHNYLMIFVFLGIGYMFYAEMSIKHKAFIDDRRKIV